eukprot:6472947-Amphidinium_carterae.1
MQITTHCCSLAALEAGDFQELKPAHRMAISWKLASIFFFTWAQTSPKQIYTIAQPAVNAGKQTHKDLHGVCNRLVLYVQDLMKQVLRSTMVSVLPCPPLHLHMPKKDIQAQVALQQMSESFRYTAKRTSMAVSRFSQGGVY